MKELSLSLARKMAGQGNSKVTWANVVHIFFASSDARLCLGSHDTYVEDVASSVNTCCARMRSS